MLQAMHALQNAITRGVIPGPQGPPEPPGESFNRWNAAEIGFFDPLYDGKSAATGNSIEHFDKDTYFRAVHAFIKRVKDMAEVKDASTVRENIYTCLRGTIC